MLLTLFWIGYIPKFSGTIASFVTCLFFYILWFFFGVKNIIEIYIVILILIFLCSVPIINKIYKDKDSKEIVIDEFIGQNIPLLAWYNSDINSSELFYKFNLNLYSLEVWILCSFVLFRFFDILKPFPISFVDNKIKNGFGVIFDDVLAGIFSTVILYMVFV
jgi:phosphatidylglycerophosphatase A